MNKLELVKSRKLTCWRMVARTNAGLGLRSLPAREWTEQRLSDEPRASSSRVSKKAKYAKLKWNILTYKFRPIPHRFASENSDDHLFHFEVDAPQHQIVGCFFARQMRVFREKRLTILVALQHPKLLNVLLMFLRELLLNELWCTCSK